MLQPRQGKASFKTEKGTVFTLDPGARRSIEVVGQEGAYPVMILQDAPRLQPASRAAPVGPKAAIGKRGKASTKDNELRILVVEDEALIALEMEAMLEELGHSVVAIAGSESEALRLSQSKHPNLILMDVRLGRGGDGVNAGTRARMEEVKPAGILSKPLLQSELKDTLERLSPG
jgi:CheY-like chemotaxis protein